MTQWFLEQALPGFPERGLRCEGDGDRWAPHSVEIAATRPHDSLPEGFFSFSSVVELLLQGPFHGRRSSASLFVSYGNICEVDILLAFLALPVQLYFEEGIISYLWIETA